jgi:hypothetical protein
MTFAQVSAADQNPIGPLGKSINDKIGMDHTGTHDTNNPAIGRILNPGNSRQVCPGIGTPVTQERDD